MDQGLLGRLLLAPLPGRLLWRLRTEATIRKALASAFTRPIDIPGALIEATLGMTHRALAATSRASDDYLKQRTLPGRLTALGLPVLVIFGADDQRWRSSSAAAYRAVPGARVELLPGVGHTPMHGRPANDQHLAAGLRRGRRASQLTAPPLSPSPFRKWRGGHLGYRPAELAGCRTRHSACNPPHHRAHGEWAPNRQGSRTYLRLPSSPALRTGCDVL